MEFLSNVDLSALSTLGIMAFGAVSVVSFFFKDLDSRTKWFLSFMFALVFSLIPADLGHLIANKIRDAFAVATGLSGVYQGAKGVVKSAGGNRYHEI